MSANRIVSFTDCLDIAANEIRGSMLSVIGDRPITIEPIVPIAPAFSVINANFAVRLMAEHYGAGTVFITTINAEKVRPRQILGKTRDKGIIFIGRDMGSFDWLTRDLGCVELYDVKKGYEGQFVSFAGKYTTAPIAAKVALGAPLSEFGEQVPVDSIKRLSLIDGTIVHIDNFGMLKFTGTVGSASDGDIFEVDLNGRTFSAEFCRRMMSCETGAWVLFPGSSFGLFELGKVREIGAPQIGARVGDVLRLRRV